MPLPCRVELVRVDPQIRSYYKVGGKRAPLHTLKGGRATPDAAEALLALHLAVADAGGTLMLTDCYRDAAVQAGARKKYETWAAAGKPKRSSAAWNGKTMKAAFVAKPGRSGHNGGRSIDVAHMEAAPASVPKDQKLDWLWAIARPLGWTPIIKIANEGESEAWHFDFKGPWAHVYEALGYAAGAMCTTLDIGEGEGLFSNIENRWIQAQLWRVGVDLGAIDGALGARTDDALAHFGLARDTDHLLVSLAAMPSQYEIKYVAGA